MPQPRNRNGTLEGFPSGIEAPELMGILTSRKGPTTRKDYRLSEEACRILEVESEHYGVAETKALELILREHRERVQKSRGRRRRRAG